MAENVPLQFAVNAVNFRNGTRGTFCVSQRVVRKPL
jgi:hypothetical protein